MGRAERWLHELCSRENVTLGVSFAIDDTRGVPQMNISIHATCRTHGHSRGMFCGAKALEAAIGGLTLHPCKRCEATK